MKMLMVSLIQLDKKEQHSHAHKLLRECLRPYDLQDTPLVYGSHGKPALAGYTPLHFNLSHADGIAACIVSDKECGIDCERVREYRPNVARRVFTAAEQAMLEAAPESERGLLFFRIWTLKEALAKADGAGLSYPMRSAGFSFDGSSISCTAGGFRFRQYILRGGGYVVSVCEKTANV
jgi:4'-phosphopantetheinyl transferase